MEDLNRYIQVAAQRGGDTAFERAIRRFLRSHPVVISRIPFLFERGDPFGRSLALNVAITAAADQPELLTALRDFALGQHGPDEQRHQAAQVVHEAGLLPAGPVRMWLGGRWQEINFMSFDIHDEPAPGHSPEVVALMGEAIEALNEGQAAKAETLLKQALEIDPDSPNLLNNLGAVYSKQGRQDEAVAIAHKLYEEYPDYLFGIVGMANLQVEQGEIMSIPIIQT